MQMNKRYVPENQKFHIAGDDPTVGSESPLVKNKTQPYAVRLSHQPNLIAITGRNSRDRKL